MKCPLNWSPLDEPDDPIPGEPEVVIAAGRHYQTVAEAIARSSAQLRRIAEHPDMQSEAVESLLGTALEVADSNDRAHQRYAVAGESLTTYGPMLDQAQDWSLEALRKAQEAAERELGASSAMNWAQQAIQAAPAGADTTMDQGTYRRAEQDMHEAQAQRRAAKQKCAEAKELRDRARPAVRGCDRPDPAVRDGIHPRLLD